MNIEYSHPLYPSRDGYFGSEDGDPDDEDEADLAAIQHATQQLVEFGIQAAATSAGPGLSGLCLRSYSSTLPATAGVLAALPAATMTSVELEYAGSGSWFSTLSSFTGLQSLTLGMSLQQKTATINCLSQIGRLRQLTHLQLLNIVDGGDMRLLPVQLQYLHLGYWSSGAGDGSVVDLQHLVTLKRLELACPQLADGSSLPSSLQSAEMSANWPAWGLLAATSLGQIYQMTSLELRCTCIQGKHRRSLEHLSNLQSLSLHLRSTKYLIGAASSWQNLPLCELSISAQQLRSEQWQEFMQCVATATMLKKLVIRIEAIQRVHEEEKLAVCEYLGDLQGLAKLSLHIDEPHAFNKRDAEHLSRLTTLTALNLCSESSGPYIDATIVCLLAVTLTGLRQLCINGDAPDDNYRCISVSVFPAIGRLVQLTSLCLEPLEHDVAVRGLQLLTDLTGLQPSSDDYFECEYDLAGFCKAGKEALQKFWAIVTQAADTTEA